MFILLLGLKHSGTYGSMPRVTCLSGEAYHLAMNYIESLDHRRMFTDEDTLDDWTNVTRRLNYITFLISVL